MGETEQKFSLKEQLTFVAVLIGVVLLVSIWFPTVALGLMVVVLLLAVAGSETKLHKILLGIPPGLVLILMLVSAVKRCGQEEAPPETPIAKGKQEAVPSTAPSETLILRAKVFSTATGVPWDPKDGPDPFVDLVVGEKELRTEKQENQAAFEIAVPIPPPQEAPVKIRLRDKDAIAHDQIGEAEGTFHVSTPLFLVAGRAVVQLLSPTLAAANTFQAFVDAADLRFDDHYKAMAEKQINLAKEACAAKRWVECQESATWFSENLPRDGNVHADVVSAWAGVAKELLAKAETEIAGDVSLVPGLPDWHKKTKDAQLLVGKPSAMKVGLMFATLNYVGDFSLKGSEAFEPLLGSVKGKDEFEREDYKKNQLKKDKKEALGKKYLLRLQAGMVVPAYHVSDFDFKTMSFEIQSMWDLGYNDSASLVLRQRGKNKSNFFKKFKTAEEAKSWKEKNKNHKDLVGELLFKIAKVKRSGSWGGTVRGEVVGYVVWNKRTGEIIQKSY